ncbi:proton-conducting transporter membrane subunit [Xanthobacter sp. V4C-4]|uniref:complex I subunit 5 family protein n=1 Tax=Xanthobacter cornucopiae TaxID=3119924 RepID=UPI0037275A65
MSALLAWCAALSAPLLVVAVILPLFAFPPLLLLRGRPAERLALGLAGLGLLVALAIGAGVGTKAAAVATFIGGWRPPLGVALRADGFSAFMLVMTAVVLVATGAFAMTAPGRSRAAGERMPPAFWLLLFSVWSALNLVFLAEDLFTLYVALELLTFAAVPLVCLEGKLAQVEAALRYLLFALFGSVLYLLGVVLVYGLYGTLDIIQLAGAARASPGFVLALAAMTAGMMAKAALFPLHLWLPPAHSGAPAAASALLSAVVIKAPIFLLVRFWLDLAPHDLAVTVAPILAGLGAAAIVVCSLVALAQPRLKLLIAYSTAAQIGYLFLMFPLAAVASPWSPLAWTGGALHLASHAFSKAAMFMAAGLIAEALGHDRLSGLSGVGRVVPVAVFAFGLGGLSLMGLPPAGGFVAKVMLLTAAVHQGAWWIAGVILLGGLLAGAYVLKVVALALQRPAAPPAARPVAAWRQWVALALALVAVGFGFVPLEPAAFLFIGRPASWAGVVP